MRNYRVKRVLILTVFLVAVLMATLMLSTGAHEQKDDITWPVNEKGESYGYILVDDEGVDHLPDLIRVGGVAIILPDGSVDPGTVGYRKKTDNDPYVGLEPPRNPEDAMRYNEQLLALAMAAEAEGLRFVFSIPVYKSDGITVIGSFGIGNTKDTIQQLTISSDE